MTAYICENLFPSTDVLHLQVRDQLAIEGVQPIENHIPVEDVLGRTYCKYTGI